MSMFRNVVNWGLLILFFGVAILGTQYLVVVNETFDNVAELSTLLNSLYSNLLVVVRVLLFLFALSIIVAGMLQWHMKRFRSLDKRRFSA
ncbi:MAG: hypothetical protein CMI54_07725 [Parcubacteria group bacterium]|nr:hypothetical protein [Parcubacteria group bacterium]|tara:strand:+ start:11255 stop:11524 length:270 start_codon:yes stop_codon:yes gene_type:complete